MTGHEKHPRSDRYGGVVHFGLHFVYWNKSQRSVPL